jgi:hypothetical protein
MPCCQIVATPITSFSSAWPLCATPTLVALACGNDRHQHDAVVNLIHQTVANRTQLDLAAIRHAVQSGCGHARMLQPLDQLILELLANGWRKLVPLLECRLDKRELIAHPALP